MGILSDILEDNRERAGQLLSATWRPRYEHEITLRPLAILPCPICPSLLHTESDLQNHILDSHRRLQTYLKVNDSVIQDLHFIEEPIRELVVVVLGERNAQLSMRLSTGIAHQVDLLPGQPKKLTSFIPESFVGSIEICLTFGRARRDSLIYCGTQPQIDIEPLNAAIWTLQESLLTGEEPDWSRFRSEFLQVGGNHPLEHRYLSGFFEYILASYLELRRSHEAGMHFERAFGLIRPFSTNLAHTARCVLGLKMNWFHLLQRCGPSSKFHAAHLFFNGRIDSLLNATRINRAVVFSDSEGVWVDPFTELLLRCIASFFRQEWIALHPLINELKQSQLAVDRNNYDKLTLIEARVHRAQGEDDLARQSYGYLQHHPLFGPEAEEFCER